MPFGRSDENDVSDAEVWSWWAEGTPVKLERFRVIITGGTDQRQPSPDSAREGLLIQSSSNLSYFGVSTHDPIQKVSSGTTADIEETA
jgi:hypothetical protein